MKRMLVITACALTLPGVTLAASRNFDTGAFEEVSVASGIKVDIAVGPTRSVVAENKSGNFDDLRISVEGKVLRIGRPEGSWAPWRPEYQVHVVTPALRSLVASSGAEATVKGSLQGDFSVNASSGSEIDVSRVTGGNVRANTSSGSEIDIAGSCISLVAQASSGSDLDAGELKCENVTVDTSSGSDVSVAATKRVSGKVSSGSDVRVRGNPVVQVDKSSGGDVTVRE